MTDDDLRRTIEDAWSYHQSLIDESDRGAAILAASNFEERLRERITSRFVDLNRKMEKRIFEGYGPLSTFAAKIDIAYALQLYDERTRGGLHTIRKIRNIFAHSSAPLEFNDEKVAELCRKLEPEHPTDRQDLRLTYLGYLSRVRDVIRFSSSR
ncbi:MAG: hypothetical protein F4204_09145 [Rhodospirillaceae bacterium]|nr:hypothetical protein [Rhodospirillaceae bacterium]